MEVTIKQRDFVNALSSLLDETFQTTHGIYLDKDTSLLRTLETISAQEASRPVGGRCASLAAQVAHVIFYLEVLERYIVSHDTSQVDWGEIWRTVERVTPAEWQELKDRLQHTYERIYRTLQELEEWNEDAISGAMVIAVHTAYHLGEIRQALCTLKG